MRKSYLYFLLLLTILNLYSQNNSNKLSIEIASGFSRPLTNILASGAGSFVAAPNLNLGVRYMFNSNFGLKGSYNYDSFEGNGIGSKHNRLNLDGYYNIGNLFDLNRISNNSVAVYTHLGAGATYVNSKINGLTVGYIPGWERQLNLTLGLSPRFRVTDVISIYTDLTYISAFKQHFNYSGEPILNAGNSGINGSHFTINFGFSFSIGNHYDHADFN